MKTLTLDGLINCFEYLDDLREGGQTNMFAARPFLRKAKRLNEELAGEVLRLWMRTFKHGISAEERARAAISKAEGKTE